MNTEDRDEIDILLVRLLPPDADPRTFTFSSDNNLTIGGLSAEQTDGVANALDRLGLLAQRADDAGRTILALKGAPQEIKSQLSNLTMDNLRARQGTGQSADESLLDEYRLIIREKLLDCEPDRLVLEFREAAREGEGRRIYVGYSWQDMKQDNEIYRRLFDHFTEAGRTWKSSPETHFTEFTSPLPRFLPGV